MILLMNEQPEAVPEGIRDRAADLQKQVDASFTSWLEKRYSGLANLPPDPPVMLHHIPRFLARRLGDDRRGKKALSWSTASPWTNGLPSETRCQTRLQFQVPGRLCSPDPNGHIRVARPFAGKLRFFRQASTTSGTCTMGAVLGRSGLAPNEVAC